MTRHVVNSDQVMHLWAHKAQDYAKNSKDSVSFQGAELKSYWLTIGHIVPDSKGNDVALILNEYSSTTTQHHISMAHSAIRNVMPQFSVPFLAPRYSGTQGEYHSANLKWFLSEYKARIAEAGRAIQYGRYRRDDARSIDETLRRYVATFGLPFTEFPDFAKDNAELESKWTARQARANDPKTIARNERAAARRVEKIREDYVACRGEFKIDSYNYRMKRKARGLMTAEDNAARAETIRVMCADMIFAWASGANESELPHYVTPTGADIERRNIVMRERRPEYLAAWIAGDNYAPLGGIIPTGAETEQRHANQLAKEAEKVESWRQGARVHLGYNLPTMLRVVGDTVQTSRGAEFPVEHARRAFPLLQRIVASGTAWQRNGHKIPLGHFQIDKVDVGGTVHAGCHIVPWSEIERAARDLGLIAE
jgi:hypothetical protein